MKDTLHEYREMRARGGAPEDVYSHALREGLTRTVAFKMLREVLGSEHWYGLPTRTRGEHRDILAVNDSCESTLESGDMREP